MTVLIKNNSGHLTNKQKEMAIEALNNEISDVMVSIDIIAEELDKSVIFGGLDIRNIAADYINKQLKCTSDGSYDEEWLQDVYWLYFPQK